MELIALCNFARLGLLAVFSNLDGKAGDDAAAEMDALAELIRQKFSATDDGLTILAECCAAILGGERLGRYIVRE